MCDCPRCTPEAMEAHEGLRTTIDELRAENKRLREALHAVMSCPFVPEPPRENWTKGTLRLRREAYNKAKKALEG